MWLTMWLICATLLSSAILEKMLRHCLVCGINDDGMQKKLLAESDLTYARAMQVAQGLETATKNLREMKAPVPPVPVKTEPVNAVRGSRGRKTAVTVQELPAIAVVIRDTLPQTVDTGRGLAISAARRAIWLRCARASLRSSGQGRLPSSRSDRFDQQWVDWEKDLRVSPTSPRIPTRVRMPTTV